MQQPFPLFRFILCCGICVVAFELMLNSPGFLHWTTVAICLLCCLYLLISTTALRRRTPDGVLLPVSFGRVFYFFPTPLVVAGLTIALAEPQRGLGRLRDMEARIGKHERSQEAPEFGGVLYGWRTENWTIEAFAAKDRIKVVRISKYGRKVEDPPVGLNSPESITRDEAKAWLQRITGSELDTWELVQPTAYDMIFTHKRFGIKARTIEAGAVLYVAARDMVDKKREDMPLFK